MSNFPPGFRFFPTEEELLSFYLHNKLNYLRSADMQRVIPVVEVFSHDPWQLPKLSGETCVQDSGQWFFFCPQQEKEACGGRPNRTTRSGYWKATGSLMPVYSSANRRLGVKKTMVFYEGRATGSKKTMWKMNEYRLLEDSAIPAASASVSNRKVRGEFSLCRLYVRSRSLHSFDRRPPAADDPASTGHLRIREAPVASDVNGFGKRMRQV